MKGSCIRLWLREHIYMKLGSWVFSVDALNVCRDISGQQNRCSKVGQSFSPLKWTGSTTNCGTAGQAVDMNGNWVSSSYVPRLLAIREDKLSVGGRHSLAPFIYIINGLITHVEILFYLYLWCVTGLIHWSKQNGVNFLFSQFRKRTEIQLINWKLL